MDVGFGLCLRVDVVVLLLLSADVDVLKADLLLEEDDDETAETPDVVLEVDRYFLSITSSG